MEIYRQQTGNLQPDAMELHRKRYLRAGIAYILAALVTIPLTLLVPGVIPEDKASSVRALWYAVPVVLIIGVYIARGEALNSWLFGRLGIPEPRRGYLSRMILKAAGSLLALSGFFRTIIFMASVFGQHLDVHPPSRALGRGFEIHLHTGNPKPVFLLGALLTGIYTLLLVRAAWLPLAASDR